MKNRGFTLIELMVTVTILLLLSVLFIANYNGFNSSQTVRQAASTVVANLQGVRTSAAAGVKPTGCDTLIGYIVNFPSASTYTSQASCQNNQSFPVTTYMLPTGVTFSPTPGSITFYALDRGASGNPTITLVGSGTTTTTNVYVYTSGVISQ